jgi:cytochrome b561
MEREQRGTPSNQLRRYSNGAIVLHWAIAGLIISNIIIGVRMRDMEGASKLDFIQAHESIGLSVMMLSLIRIGWRVVHRPPTLPPDMRRWERWLAHSVHAGLYLIMFALPLSGWILVSTKITLPPISLFGAVPWPWFPIVHDLASSNPKEFGGTAALAHVLLGRITLLLILLHLAGAIKHMTFRDGIVWRMLPLRPLLPRRPRN